MSKWLYNSILEANSALLINEIAFFIIKLENLRLLNALHLLMFYQFSIPNFIIKYVIRIIIVISPFLFLLFFIQKTLG